MMQLFITKTADLLVNNELEIGDSSKKRLISWVGFLVHNKH